MNGSTASATPLSLSLTRTPSARSQTAFVTGRTLRHVLRRHEHADSSVDPRPPGLGLRGRVESKRGCSSTARHAGITTTPPGGSPANPFVLTGQTQPASPTLKPFGTPPKSPVNLLGEVEKWGINPATTVSNVNLNVSQMTGAQLNELLKKLPDGVTYSLNLEKENQ